MISNQNIKRNKESGFTIIEMLVVTLILVLITVALATIVKGLITSSTRIKRMQTVRAQTQEAIHYLTKELRMSEFQSGSSSQITFNWRKETSDGYYETVSTSLNENSIESFFSDEWVWTEENSLQFMASGTDSDNRVVMKFNVKVNTGITTNEEVTIPVQTMVSLRSYNLE